MAVHQQILLLPAKASCQIRGGEIQGKAKGSLRVEGGNQARECLGAKLPLCYPHRDSSSTAAEPQGHYR